MSKYTTIPVTPVGNFTTTSQAFPMDNYRIINFFVETKGADAEVSFKVEASKDGGALEALGFQFMENGAPETEAVPAAGKTVTNGGAESKTWQLTVSDGMLARGEYDSVTLTVTEKAADSVTSIFALQTQPRYSE